MKNLYNFKQAELYYTRGLSSKLKSDDAWLFTRKFWDNASPGWNEPFQNVKLNDEYSCLKSIQRVFGRTYSEARIMRPLGDFKKYDNIDEITHEDIYNDFVEVMERGRKPYYKGKKWNTTFLEVCYEAFKRASDECSASFCHDEDYFIRGLSVMLYRSSWGVLKEIETVLEVGNLLGYHGLKVRAADPEDEKDDVDMFIYDDEYEIAVSIKNGYALNKNTINSKRRYKKKPVIYCGFDRHNKLTFMDRKGNEVDIRKVVEIFD